MPSKWKSRMEGQVFKWPAGRCGNLLLKNGKKSICCLIKTVNEWPWIVVVQERKEKMEELQED